MKKTPWGRVLGSWRPHNHKCRILALTSCTPGGCDSTRVWGALGTFGVGGPSVELPCKNSTEALKPAGQRNTWEPRNTSRIPLQRAVCSLRALLKASWVPNNPLKPPVSNRRGNPRNEGLEQLQMLTSGCLKSGMMVSDLRTRAFAP